MNGISHLTMFQEPVKPWPDEPAASEIMINGPECIRIGKSGKVIRTDAVFPGEPALRATANNIAGPAGRVLNDEYPRPDARLPDGSRVHVVIPPPARCGTAASIRKSRTDSPSPESPVTRHNISPEMPDYPKSPVRRRMNMTVCGATSSGKTPILNVLSSFIAPADRLRTIKDSCELQPRQPHPVPFAIRRPDRDGKGEVTFRELRHSALRPRPDRPIPGKIRGGEAPDILQAMNTGHSGPMSAIHANDERDSLLRLETCVMYAGYDRLLNAIRDQIVAAPNDIVHTGRPEDGSRKVPGISRVLPLDHGGYRLKSGWNGCGRAWMARDGSSGNFAGRITDKM